METAQSMNLKIILFSALFFLANPMFAQVKFVAKASKEKLAINERLRVDFEMNQDGDHFQPPSFKGFRVVAGPNQSVSNMWINGKRTYSKTFSYFLSPTATGTFTIDQATIEIEGETFKTIPITVVVGPAVDTPKDENNNTLENQGDIHLVAEVSKASPYLNEAITVVYKLYVSPETSVSGWRELDKPKYADFWSQDTDSKQLQVHEGTYKGKPYRYAILRSTVLYPQKSGQLKIEPLSLDVQVEVSTNRRDIFGRPFMTRVNRTLSSSSRTINVKPLPLEGQPANFSGAVGSFDLKVTTNKNQLDAKESLEVTVAVSGNGNLKLFKPPTLAMPTTFEVYEPEFKDRVNTSQAGMRGSISENYTVIPQFQGTYSIEPIAFSYFDLKTNSYKTLFSKEIPITVEGGPIATTQNLTTPNAYKQPVVLTGDSFKFIKLKPNLAAVNQAHFYKTPLFWTLLASPLVMLPLFLFLGIRKKEAHHDVAGQRLKKANRLAKKYLYEARKNRGEQKIFYESLERALHNYLKAKLTIETSEFSKERIQGILVDKNVKEQTAISFVNLLKSCEYARYTPTTDGAIQVDYDHAVEVIASIDKQIG